MSHSQFQSHCNALRSGACFTFHKNGEAVVFYVALSDLETNNTVVAEDGTRFVYERKTNTLRLEGDESDADDSRWTIN